MKHEDIRLLYERAQSESRPGQLYTYFAKLVEQATLERAAKVCEAQADRFNQASPLNGTAQYAAIECSKAIGALKDSND